MSSVTPISHAAAYATDIITTQNTHHTTVLWCATLLLRYYMLTSLLLNKDVLTAKAVVA
jgi:hypothetical protein